MGHQESKGHGLVDQLVDFEALLLQEALFPFVEPGSLLLLNHLTRPLRRKR